MKYLGKGRDVCKDAREQKVVGLALYAGFFYWNYVCESGTKRIYYKYGHTK